MQRHGIHRSVGIRVESGIKRSVRIQPCHPVARHTTHLGEIPGDQDLAVRLQGNRPHRIVDFRRERRVKVTIRIDPRESAPDRPVHLREITTQQDLAVVLLRKAEDGIVGGNLKRAINRSIFQ